jgi:MEDS: MEthanogen/methylotroph, DcmR Sensory domain
MLAFNKRERVSDIFWGELAPCEHLLQLYDDDDVFLDTLESYVCNGLHAGEAVVIISTTRHAKDLSARLRLRGIDMDAERRSRNLILLNAEETLHSFVDDGGWPNDDKFYEVIKRILRRARGEDNRRVRAFGEMVAVLWSRGQNAATVRLEHLWHKLCQEEEFQLFCAYPKAGFTDYALKSLQDICSAHSRLIH